jgi:hypothetical protein
MSKVEHIRGDFVEFIPGSLENGVLYVSDKYKTASHLCGCGCGNKVVTPLKPGGWRLTTRRGAVTLYPSIGNWNLPCRSHYWIRGDKIVWASNWSEAEVEAGRRSDQRAREKYFNASPQIARESFFRGILNWFLRIIRGQKPD